MSPAGANIVINDWLQRPRIIEWNITMGLSAKRRPNIYGVLTTTLSYLDDQGEKWGDTYIKIVGQHYDDYAHWDEISWLLPIGGRNGLPNFVPHQFIQARSALQQLLSYWRAIPSVAGYGMFLQVDIEPITKLKMHLLIPKEDEIDNVRLIITGNVGGTGLPTLPDKPILKEFSGVIGGRLFG